jgi:hypothetical protein
MRAGNGAFLKNELNFDFEDLGPLCQRGIHAVFMRDARVLSRPCMGCQDVNSSFFSLWEKRLAQKRLAKVRLAKKRAAGLLPTEAAIFLREDFRSFGSLCSLGMTNFGGCRAKRGSSVKD